MSFTADQYSVGILDEPSTPDRSMLSRIVTEVARITGSTSAYLEHFQEGADGQVVASFGPEAPPLGSHSLYGPASPPRLTIPLNLDGRTIGAIVCLGVPRNVALDPAQPGQIELLGTLATAALRNVSLANELEIAAAAALEHRFRLLNGLVHYLRNTLGAANEYVQLIDTESEMTTRQRGYISASQRNIENALRLLTELLDLGRVETGRLAVQMQPTDPAAVVRGIARDYELSNGMSGVYFDLSFPAPLPMIVTDIDLMRRILDTLISNAVKYTPTGCAIHISGDVRAGRRAGDAREFICITVRDEGPGIIEREQVFDEVLRAEKAATATPGFRLAISRRIARLLGGDLSLDPPTQMGTSFSLWLPTAVP